MVGGIKMNYLLVYGNVDTNGDFTEVILGEHIIPNKQYDYFFFITDPNIMSDISKYKVDLTTRELVLKS
jgi:hypothetical protein